MNLDREDHRIDSAYLAYEQPFAANASAIVFLFANLNYLMNTGGPDLYRLAHLEAGMVAQRLYVAANSFGMGGTSTGEFYDDEVRKFLGLARTGWEPIDCVAIGVSTDDKVVTAHVDQADEEGLWRD